MSLEYLPTELLNNILAYLPYDVSFHFYVELRLLSRRFNDLILYALFDLGIGRLHYPHGIRGLAKSNYFVFRYWKGHLQGYTLPICNDRNSRTTEQLRGTSFVTANIEHQVQVRSVLKSAILRIEPTVEAASWYPSNPQLRNELSLFERCVHVLCDAAILVHGSQIALDLLNTNIEEDFFQSFVQPGSLFIPSQHVEIWILYAAINLRNIEVVKFILESMKIKPADRNLWHRRLSTTYIEFVCPRMRRFARTWQEKPPNGTLEEQRWIRAVSSAFIIAASQGYTDLVSQLLQIEPNVMRKTFRTSLYRTSRRDAMGAAISNNQIAVFNVLAAHTPPLVTRTGFARKEYFSALALALHSAAHDFGSRSILGTLLRMTEDWQCPYFLDHMTQVAAQRNNVELGKVLLEQLINKSSKIAAYHWLRTDQPSFNIGTQPKKFAIATATCLGHVEFVKFLLDIGQRSNEAGIQARDCAIHSLTCHVQVLTKNHIAILKHLLEYTDGMFLEDALIKAAYRHDKHTMTVFSQALDLNQSAYSKWNRDEPRHCYDTEQMKNAWILEPGDSATLGEVALAATLKGGKLRTAYMMIEEYNLKLRRYIVRTQISSAQASEHELTSLKKLVRTKGMTIDIETPNNNEGHSHRDQVSTLVFRPTPHPNTALIEFNLGKPHFCMI